MHPVLGLTDMEDFLFFFIRTSPLKSILCHVLPVVPHTVKRVACRLSLLFCCSTSSFLLLLSQQPTLPQWKLKIEEECEPVRIYVAAHVGPAVRWTPVRSCWKIPLRQRQLYFYFVKANPESITHVHLAELTIQCVSICWGFDRTMRPASQIETILTYIKRDSNFMGSGAGRKAKAVPPLSLARERTNSCSC